MNIAERGRVRRVFPQGPGLHGGYDQPRRGLGADQAGHPVLVGRLAWNPSSSGADDVESGSTLKWTLILLERPVRHLRDAMDGAARQILRAGAPPGVAGSLGRRSDRRRRRSSGGSRTPESKTAMPRPVRTWRRSKKRPGRQTVVCGRRMRHNRRPCPQQAVEPTGRGTRSGDHAGSHPPGRLSPAERRISMHREYRPDDMHHGHGGRLRRHPRRPRRRRACADRVSPPLLGGLIGARPDPRALRLGHADDSRSASRPR